MDFEAWMSAFSGFVWSTPTAILLTGAGLLFTIMTAGIQWRALTHGFAVIRGKYDNPDDIGNISHFQALCAALSATIGLGNISGAAVAVTLGGPGAVFWMWVVGFLGMATKFTTCSLATMYRQQDASGTYRGGPMYYIEMGLGKNWKPLAILFAILGMSASVGAGNMFQSNQVAKIFVNFFKVTTEGGITAARQFQIQVFIGVVLCVFAGIVMIGGIKRIGNVASKLVPSMCVIYVVGALYVIFTNFDRVPEAFGSIFSNAFTASAGKGAFLGVAVKTAMILGVKRACFSNEAGLGSAPIAHATAKTNEPIREGIVAATGPFIDTVVICTMTALVVLCTGTLSRDPIARVTSVEAIAPVAVDTTHGLELPIRLTILDAEHANVGEVLFVHKPPAIKGGEPENVQFRIKEVNGSEAIARVEMPDSAKGRAQLEADAAVISSGADAFLFRDGVELTAYAFDRGLPGFGTYFIPIAAVLFAFSTIVSWGFYGETCTEYLFGERAVLPFKFIYVGMIVVGTLSMKLQPVLDWSDGMLGLMLVPNLIGTLFLAPRVMRASKDYFRRLSAGEFDEDVRRAAAAKKRAGENI